MRVARASILDGTAVSESRGDNLKDFKDLYPEAKAIIWP